MKNLKMEKIKFGIQLTILMLAFPVLFVTEIKQADEDMKKINWKNRNSWKQRNLQPAKH
ncbi:MAG: hypothetical protein IPP96_16885 [Chitinophagaceae bacterium]|nr:hypothetical protein [Chitinophagaceae bacterium]